MLETPPAVEEEKEPEGDLQRKRELKPLAKQIKQWLDVHSTNPQEDFYEKLSTLIQSYRERDFAILGKPAEELTAVLTTETPEKPSLIQEGDTDSRS